MTFRVTVFPHAAYAAFIYGLSSKWNYLLRVTDWKVNQSDDILEALALTSATFSWGTNARDVSTTCMTGWLTCTCTL